MITLADFQTKPYMVMTSPAKPAVVENVQNQHHKLEAGYFAGTVSVPSHFPNVFKIEIGAGNDTVYLPYYQNAVSSVRLPHTQGASFFVTDNLSGCAIYITRNGTGRLAVFHANTQSHSSEAELADKKPDFQDPRSVNELSQFRTNAVNNHRDNPVVVATLTKATYLRGVGMMTKKNSEYLGGVAVAGWRTGTSWEFWYQVFGSVKGAATRVLYVQQFYQS